jgi:predicted house-cleaning noncanonical NTP pyrophosphatase (MazG superfamily)
MFTIPLEQIFTTSNLKDSFLEISSKSTGLDEVSYNEFKKDFSKNLDETISSIVTGDQHLEILNFLENVDRLISSPSKQKNVFDNSL